MTVDALEQRQLLSGAIITTVDGVRSDQSSSVTLSAGQALHVNAVQNYIPILSTSDPLNTLFNWNFGDTSSTSEYNTMPGFNAAHIYDTPGTYTLTLTTTEGTAASKTVSTAQLTVNVNANSQASVYVSSEAGVTNTNVNDTSPSNPVSFSAFLSSGLQSETKYLFAKGDTFSFYNQNQIDFTNVHDVTFDSFDYNGTGQPAPVFNDTGLLQDTLFVSYSAVGTDKNIRIQNLRITANDASTVKNVAYVGGTNFIFRNNSFGYVWYVAQDSPTGDSGTLLQGNTVDPGTMQGYFLFLADSDYVLLGNTINGFGAQILIRAATNTGSSAAQRLLVYDNTLDSTTTKGDIALQHTSDVYIAGNQILGESVGVGPITQGPGPAQWTVIEGNYFDNGSGIGIVGGAWDTEIRNNVFNQSINNAVIYIGGYQSVANVNMDVVDLRILHNTIIGSSSQTADTQAIWVQQEVFGPGETPGANRGIDLEGNIYVSPYLSNQSIGDNVYLKYADDLLSFDTIADNVWQTPTDRRNASDGNQIMFYVGGDGGPVSLQQWNAMTLSNGTSHPSDSTYATGITDTLGTNYTPAESSSDVASLLNSGPALPGIFSDFYGNHEPSSGLTVGAVLAPPVSPTNVTSAGSGSVLVQWTGNLATANDPTRVTLTTNLQGYNVYRASSTTGPWILVNSGPITGTSFTDTPGSGTWYYSVTSVDAAGNESSRAVASSGPVLLNILGASAPSAGSQNIYDQQIVNSGGVELGMKFRSDEAGFVTGVRFYKSSNDTGTHTGELWSSSGQLLATATFSNETASGWQEVTFSNPVAISANTTYIIAYHSASGYLSFTSEFFQNAGVDNGPLHALQSGVDGGNDVYQYGSSAFPSAYNGYAGNYWVDADFVASSPLTVFGTSAPSASSQNIYDQQIVNSGGVELGMKFRSDEDGYVTGVRFYKSSDDTGTHTGELWSSSGQLLAAATFSNETASGWQEVTFSNPVAVSANTTYIIAYHSTSGYLSFTSEFFQNSGVDNGPLHGLQSGVDGGNDVYQYGSSACPGSYNGYAGNYWVDAVFQQI